MVSLALIELSRKGCCEKKGERSLQPLWGAREISDPLGMADLFLVLLFFFFHFFYIPRRPLHSRKERGRERKREERKNDPVPSGRASSQLVSQG